IGDSIVEGAQCKIMFRLVGDSAATMAYQVFGNTFNLEEPKKSLIHPLVVGYEKILLKGKSKGSGTNAAHTYGSGECHEITDTDGVVHAITHSETESEGESDTETVGDTDGHGQSQGRIKGTDSGSNSSHTDSRSEPETNGYFVLRPNPNAQISTADSLGASTSSFESESTASDIMHAHTNSRAHTVDRGRAVTDGVTDTVSRTKGLGHGVQKNHTDIVGTSTSESESVQEALLPILENRPGATYSLEELKHRYAMLIANLEERHAIVKIQNLKPVIIRVNTVEPPLALAHQAAAFAALLTQSDEYTKPRALIERELAARPLQLIQEAAEWRRDQEQEYREIETDDDLNENI